jgi:hypothetical protein
VFDEDNAVLHATVIDMRLAMALWMERFQTHHLRVRQPEKVAKWSVFLQRLNPAASATSMGPDPSLEDQALPISRHPRFRSAKCGIG